MQWIWFWLSLGPLLWIPFLYPVWYHYISWGGRGIPTMWRKMEYLSNWQTEMESEKNFLFGMVLHHTALCGRIGQLCCILRGVPEKQPWWWFFLSIFPTPRVISRNYLLQKKHSKKIFLVHDSEPLTVLILWHLHSHYLYNCLNLWNFLLNVNVLNLLKEGGNIRKLVSNSLKPVLNSCIIPQSTPLNESKATFITLILTLFQQAIWVTCIAKIISIVPINTIDGTNNPWHWEQISYLSQLEKYSLRIKNITWGLILADWQLLWEGNF